MNQSKERSALQAIASQMACIPGHLGFYYKNLVTGFEYGIHEDETFLAASVIKLPLFLHILRESHAGRMRMEERLCITEADKVPICGALSLFTGSVETDVRTLCRLMISISDNTATNRLIRHATLDGAAAGLRVMGLEKTQLKRLLFDAAAAEAGLQNVICPREIGRLLESLHRGSFVSPEVCREALDVLLLQ